MTKEQRPWNKKSEATWWKPESKPFGNNRYDADFYQSVQWKDFRRYIQSHRPMICVQCKGAAKYLDHIIPISQGGARLDESNVQWLCSRCHVAKTNKERHQNKSK